jgi:adenylate cyclase
MTYLSHVQYVDSQHVALSCQFFNKTRRNLLENDRAAVLVVDPHTAKQYHLDVTYLRAETSGPLFEKMKLRLDAIASLSGMTGLFRLIGADVFRVLECRAVLGSSAAAVNTRGPALPGLAHLSTDMAACEDLSTLLDVTLAGLAQHLGYHHALVLLLDEARRRLYTVASHGYPESGAGSEVALGQGPIGVAADRGIPVRSTHMTRDLVYGRAVRQRLLERGDASALEREIALPGLPDACSQLAMPIRTRERALGVLCVQSAESYAFTEHDEVLLRVIADHLATATMLSTQMSELQPLAEKTAESTTPVAGSPILIRHYAHDHSIFIGGDYLIKGVAGAILWKLVTDHVRAGRTQFTNRELRLDPAIGLPDLSDNLEARLVLLKRRLEDRDAVLRIEKEGRGRFRLTVSRPLELQDVGR